MRQFQQSNWRRIARSFRNAGRGIGSLLARQRNARIHLVAAVAVVALGAVLRVSRFEWAVLILCIALVITAEALNTAVEELADALHPDEHPGIGRAKDVAAAGVLVAALLAAVVGALVFAPKLLAL